MLYQGAAGHGKAGVEGDRSKESWINWRNHQWNCIHWPVKAKLKCACRSTTAATEHTKKQKIVPLLDRWEAGGGTQVSKETSAVGRAAKGDALRDCPLWRSWKITWQNDVVLALKKDHHYLGASKELIACRDAAMARNTRKRLEAIRRTSDGAWKGKLCQPKNSLNCCVFETELGRVPLYRRCVNSEIRELFLRMKIAPKTDCSLHIQLIDNNKFWRTIVN